MAIYVDDEMVVEKTVVKSTGSWADFFGEIVAEVPLTEGKHRFKLEYFQQGGQAGLEASYKQKDSKELNFIGEDSPLVKFY